MSAALKRLAAIDFRARAPAGALDSLKPRLDSLAAQLSKALEPLAGPAFKLAADTVERADQSDAYESDLHWISIRLVSDRDGVEVTARLHRDFIFALCEAAFGGGGAGKPYREERPFSTIERKLCDEIFTALVNTLPQMFIGTPCAGATFEIATEANTKVSILPPLLAEAKLLLNAFGYSGEIVLGLTKAIVETLQIEEPAPRKQAPPPRAGVESQMRGRLGAIDLPLTVVLAEVELDLRELSSLHVGKLIKLPTRLDSALKVYCEDRHLFDATFTRSDTSYTICINRLSA